MTKENFIALKLNQTSALVAIHLKDNQPTIQPAKLQMPLPGISSSLLLFSAFQSQEIPQNQPGEFAAIAQWINGSVDLDEVESIEILTLA